jgi:hypothetical protein
MLPRLNVGGFHIAPRGNSSLQVEEIISDFNNNRLPPRLTGRQVNMLYGRGPAVYRQQTVDGKDKQVRADGPLIMSWLEGWTEKGMETDYKSFSRAVIKNFYYFRDFFVKWRMAAGGLAGRPPQAAGLEALENKHCRLATARKDVAGNIVGYSDLRHVATGMWGYGISGYRFYPRFTIAGASAVKAQTLPRHRKANRRQSPPAV